MDVIIIELTKNNEINIIIKCIHDVIEFNKIFYL